MPPATKQPRININTIGVLVMILGGIASVAFFFAPLQTLPEDMKEVQRTQAAQTETLKVLANLVQDNKDLRKDFENHKTESLSAGSRREAMLEDVRRRLDKLEHQ